MTRARVGIFGGTFDPIHQGHLRVAEEAREAFDLERVILVPAGLPPHKESGARSPRAPAALRLAWVEQAIADNPTLCVDPLELQREGPSYTIDTIRSLRTRSGPEPPVFVIGCDAFALLGSWHRPAEVLASAHFAVVTRPPTRADSLANWLPDALRGDFELSPDERSATHRQASTWVRLLEIPGLEVSSSEIRRRLREGRSVRYLLPEAVLAPILESGIYQQSEPGENV